MRIEKNYKGLAQVCKATFDKLKTVHSRLNEIQKEIREDVLGFVETSLIFSKAYALWA